MKTGDVLSYSWGYDQTNVEFFLVEKATDKSVWLKPIGAKLLPDEGCGPMSGKTVPDPSVPASWCSVKSKGPKRIQKGYGGGEIVSMPHGIAKVWDGQAEYTSWYA